MRYCSLFILLICHSSYSQISSTLKEKMTTDERVPVIIELKDQADLSGIKESWTKLEKGNYVYNLLKTHSTQTQKELLEYLNAKQIEHRSFYLVNIIWAKLSKSQIEEISSFASVKNLCFDSYTQVIPSQDKTSMLTPRNAEITWGIKRVGADKVWLKGYEGQGVVVGGNDTGVKWDISAIKERYRGFENNMVDHNYNWHDAIHQNSPLSGGGDNPCGLNLREPCDDNAHGTHTVGTMVGLTAEHAIGMAPQAQWIGCRNMERGNGAPSTYIECFEFFLAPYDLDGLNVRPELAPHVINNSWYCSLQEGCDPTTYPVMEVAIENLRAAGIVVVVSAGNDGAACNTLRHVPAIYKNSFTVGAIAQNDTISGFSSNGPVTNYKDTLVKPNVVAPGSDVISMLPDESYGSWNGTSMAGPHVAGLVALMISANPVLAGHVEQIETIIEETAEQIFSEYDCFPTSGLSIPNNTYGFGLINAELAVEKALIAVSTVDKLKNEFRLYPNPVRHQLKIERSDENDIKVCIKDVLGKNRMQFSLKEKIETIDVSGLKQGVYFLWNESKSRAFPLIKI